MDEIETKIEGPKDYRLDRFGGFRRFASSTDRFIRPIAGSKFLGAFAFAAILSGLIWVVVTTAILILT